MEFGVIPVVSEQVIWDEGLRDHSSVAWRTLGSFPFWLKDSGIIPVLC